MGSENTLPPPRAAKPASRSSIPIWDGRLVLRFTDSSGPKRVEIERTTVLGSSENVDVSIADGTVSRIHAEIEMGTHGAWVRDLGSLNGTFVDRVEVKGARIHVGSVLRLGSAEIHLEAVGGPPESVELWPETHLGPLVGQSPAMREMFAMLARVAQSEIPVFIRGETGSGKELVARAIHEASPRKNGPYIVVDCAALAENLLESELFGHARGAFTGATGAREGAIESGSGGTVFLDEIGELPLDMQPKLLRVLEQHTVRRVGESEHRHVDVRFIAATHRDLVDFVARGWFREDLYFRLAVLPMRVPPLRERPEDIELLAAHFLGPLASSLLTPSFVAELESRPWRGNVRELRNVLDRVRALGMERALSHERSESPGSFSPAVVPISTSGTVTIPPLLMELPHRDFRERWTELGEKAFLERKLTKHAGNVSRVSREIELARTYVHKLMKKHGL